MNEWDKLQAENEQRCKVEIKRRVDAAEAEVRIMQEVTGVLIGFAIVGIILLVVGLAWKFFNK